jgi:hypothetical protein
MKRKEKTATRGWSSGSGRRVAVGRRGRERAWRCSMVGAGTCEVGKSGAARSRSARCGGGGGGGCSRGRSGERRRAGGNWGEVGTGEREVWIGDASRNTACLRCGTGRRRWRGSGTTYHLPDIQNAPNDRNAPGPISPYFIYFPSRGTLENL